MVLWPFSLMCFSYFLLFWFFLCHRSMVNKYIMCAVNFRIFKPLHKYVVPDLALVEHRSEHRPSPSTAGQSGSAAATRRTLPLITRTLGLGYTRQFYKCRSRLGNFFDPDPVLGCIMIIKMHKDKDGNWFRSRFMKFLKFPSGRYLYWVPVLPHVAEHCSHSALTSPTHMQTRCMDDAGSGVDSA